MYDFSRRQSNRSGSVAGRMLHGIIVNNNDPDKMQRVKIRVESLHKGIKDADLPWSMPLVNTGSAGSANSLGTVQVPAKGTKVWLRYEDSSLYHSFYFGAVPQKDTRVKELGGSGEEENKNSSTGSSNTGNTTNTSSTNTSNDSGSGDDDANDYPHVNATIDQSGNKISVNTKRDTLDWTHVSGTRVEVDGAGRMKITVNDKKVGKDAKQKHSKGLTLIVVGDVNITATQNVTLNAMKDFFLNVKGKFIAKVTENIEFNAKQFLLKLKSAPTTNLEWVVGGGSPESPDITDPGTIKSRSRPEVPDPENKDNK